MHFYPNCHLTDKIVITRTLLPETDGSAPGRPQLDGTSSDRDIAVSIGGTEEQSPPKTVSSSHSAPMETD